MLEGKILDEVLALTLSHGVSEGTVQILRASWPGVHFSYCMDDDIGGVEPVRSAPGVNIYLVNGSGHCLALTSDFEVATGLVVAEVEDDCV